MRIIEQRKEFQCCNSGVVIGKFEGMHLGHQELLNRLQSYNVESRVMFTFDQNPGKVVHGQNKVLLTKEERRHYVEHQVDVLIEYPFDKETRQMKPLEFIKQVLVEQLHSKIIIVGNDFYFGYQRQGSVETLMQYEQEFGYRTVVVPQVLHKDEAISSTRIKQTLEQGYMEEANEMLGYSFYVEGTVEHGNQIGRTIGVPTANIIPDDEKFLPPNGVYFSRIILDNMEYYGITNIGCKPTIQGNNPQSVETNIFDFNQDIYGKTMKVELLVYERPETKYQSLELLAAQLQKDVIFGKELYSKIMLDK